jgi:hypothetical protein
MLRTLIMILWITTVVPKDFEILTDWYHNQRMVIYLGMHCIEKRGEGNSYHRLFCSLKNVIVIEPDCIDNLVEK